MYDINDYSNGKRSAMEVFLDMNNKRKYSFAVEKLWDAFERIKTYYDPNLNKRESLNKMLDSLGINNSNIRELFNDEFKTLTNIGNSYRIRHHEKNKIDIKSDLHYKYFYKRCYSLVSEVMELLQ